eukprot:s1_g1786.t1
MDFDQRILLSLIGAIIGFAVSQSFNVVRFLRRPKFAASQFENGVLSSYTGNPPETPSSVTLGFYLENAGRNPAKNTRVFLSKLSSSATAEEPPKEGIFEFSELKRPIDIIPPGESVLIELGTIDSEGRHLKVPFAIEGKEELYDYVEADTRGKKSFDAVFQISCDDLNSFTSLELSFRPTKESWAGQILSDMENHKRFPFL